jgi:hypothetical protein
LYPFDPAVVIGILAEATTPINKRTGEPHTPCSRCSSSESSSLPPKDWHKIQNIVNKTMMKVTGGKHRKRLKYLGDKVISQPAVITLLQEGNKRLSGSLQEDERQEAYGRV